MRSKIQNASDFVISKLILVLTEAKTAKPPADIHGRALTCHGRIIAQAPAECPVAPIGTGLN